MHFTYDVKGINRGSRGSTVVQRKLYATRRCLRMQHNLGLSHILAFLRGTSLRAAADERSNLGHINLQIRIVTGETEFQITRDVFIIYIRGSRALSDRTFRRLNTVYYAQSARGVSCCAHMASRRVVCIPRVSLSVNAGLKREQSPHDRYSADLIGGQMSNARVASAAGADSRDLLPFARVHCPLNRRAVSLSTDPVNSRRIPHRSNSGRSLSIFPPTGHDRLSYSTSFLSRETCSHVDGKSTRCGRVTSAGEKGGKKIGIATRDCARCVSWLSPYRSPNRNLGGSYVTERPRWPGSGG